MLIFFSINNVPIRMTDERWEHITRRHPEMRNQMRKVMETIEKPQYVLKGDYGELLAVRFYENTPLTEKYLIVAYKEISENDGFVITAYFAREFSKKREVLWKL